MTFKKMVNVGRRSPKFCDGCKKSIVNGEIYYTKKKSSNNRLRSNTRVVGHFCEKCYDKFYFDPEAKR